MNHLRANCLVSLCFLTISTVAISIVSGAEREPRSYPQASASIIEMTNKFRVEKGLDKLTTNEALTKASVQFGEFMAKESKYGHQADGRQPAQRAEAAGYEYCVVRENIAYRIDPTNPESSALAQKFYTGWKESEGHRENMLGDYVSETGVAVISLDGKTYYAVQMFGRPESAKFEFQVKNELPSPQRVRFATEDSQDEIEVPPGATLMMTRCIPTEMTLPSSGERMTIHQSGKYVIRKDADGKLVIKQEDGGR